MSEKNKKIKVAVYKDCRYVGVYEIPKLTLNLILQGKGRYCFARVEAWYRQNLKTNGYVNGYDFKVITPDLKDEIRPHLEDIYKIWKEYSEIINA